VPRSDNTPLKELRRDAVAALAMIVAVDLGAFLVVAVFGAHF
jgi:hypothetical protein